MAVITKSWLKDLILAGTAIVAVVYFTFGTWMFSAMVYAFLTVYLFYQYKFLHWRRHGIPASSPRFPFGDVWGIFRKAPGEVLKDMYDRGKGHRFVGVWFLFKPAILLRDPELIKEILVREFITFQERGIYMNEKSDPLSGESFYFAWWSRQNGQWKHGHCGLGYALSSILSHCTYYGYLGSILTATNPTNHENLRVTVFLFRLKRIKIN